MKRVAHNVPRVKCRMIQTLSSNGTHERHVATCDWVEIQSRWIRDKGNPSQLMGG